MKQQHTSPSPPSGARGRADSSSSPRPKAYYNQRHSYAYNIVPEEPYPRYTRKPVTPKASPPASSRHLGTATSMYTTHYSLSSSVGSSSTTTPRSFSNSWSSSAASSSSPRRWHFSHGSAATVLGPARTTRHSANPEASPERRAGSPPKMSTAVTRPDTSTLAALTSMEFWHRDIGGAGPVAPPLRDDGLTTHRATYGATSNIAPSPPKKTHHDKQRQAHHRYQAEVKASSSNVTRLIPSTANEIATMRLLSDETNPYVSPTTTTEKKGTNAHPRFKEMSSSLPRPDVDLPMLVERQHGRHKAHAHIVASPSSSSPRRQQIN
eukprot:PhM_4_TR4293/c0_g1_i1/m.41130